MRVLLGTTNPSKVKRFSDLLKGYGIEFITLRDIEVIEEPEEMGNTPEENAIMKAEFYGQYFDVVICNDSGLYFEELDFEDLRQPGLNIRTPMNRDRLSDEEMIDFIKGHMCSPAIATQAEDLIAGGVKELIHVGYAGGLQPELVPGEIILTDGAFNDTAVARLYGYDYDIIHSSKDLTNEIEEMITSAEILYKRGFHWTTDAGYRETWGQVMDYRDKGALCVEMEGVGLFTIANYRKCVATGIYVVSDVYLEDDWKLGWEGNDIKKAVGEIIDMIIKSIR